MPPHSRPRQATATALVFAFVVLLLGVAGAPAGAQAAPCDPPVTNPVACENTRPGNPASEWDVSGAGSTTIQGFSTDISVDQGQTVQFKIDTPSNDYRLDVYRMGYYGGSGARRVATVQPSAALPQNQPDCLYETSTGLIDCGNWALSASWPVPADAVSGIYFAKLVREDGTAGSSHVVFVVRDDDGGSDLLFQTSDTTWQAYNDYGGNSLYTGQPDGRAYAVSYNRPFVTRGCCSEDWVFNAEYPMVRWLEANGYDVSYSAGVDTDRRGGELLEHEAFLSVGHDEYWSGAQRANVEAARGAGVHLAFFSGNEVFWKTRWRSSIDGSGTPHRTLVTYKETHADAKIDPDPAWTGTWRDPRFSPPSDGGRPENALTGQIFTVNCCSSGATIRVPQAEGRLRLWRDTSVASLPAGGVATLSSNTLNYEWDEDLDNGFRPPGLVRLSSATYSNVSRLQDYGSSYGSGTATHSLTLYRHASGALVFGAGTVQWSWGLDGNHDRQSSIVDVRMQQATVNLFADMGIQPRTLQSGLVPATAGTDTAAPSSTVTSPTAGAELAVGTPVTISGTASDTGGRVGGVEVSVDDGTTWRRATGLESWTYSWTPPSNGTATIRSRAVDDSGNLGNPSAGVTVTIGSGPPPPPGTCPCSIWDGGVVPGTVQDPDRSGIEVGVQFRASVDGFVTGVRFYKGPSNTGTHVGNLWSGSGERLASATFTGETASGWQQVVFASPVAVTAGTTYVASYHAPVGRYSVDEGYFASQGVERGPLRALADGEDGANGVYRYGSSSGFPTSTYRSSNYWVDVVFDTSGADTTPPTVTGRSPGSGATGVAVGADVTATFSEPVQAGSVGMSLSGPGGAVVPAAVTYDAASRTARLNPNADLTASTSYTATVSSATDAAGNPLAAPVAWTFTTAAAASPPPGSCPCSIWSSSTTPGTPAAADRNAVELGVRFRASVDGFVTGIRFYKGPGNTGTHVGNLWSGSGERLASVTFTGESASGWQQATLPAPVAVTAGTVYVASYHAPAGRYAVDQNFFASAGVDSGPLRALRDGETGANGVYRYGAGAFPTNTFRSSNYWVDVVFETAAADTTTPTVTARTPAPGATDVALGANVTATFSEPVQAGSVGMELRGPGGVLVPAALTYDAPSRTATLNPNADLAASTGYTATVTSAIDAAGNPMTAPVSWTFTTGNAPPPPPDQGPGGPVLAINTGSNPFSRYYSEILRNEGLNAFATADIAAVTPTLLAQHDVAILGEMELTTAQVGMLTDWVNAGGNLIAMRPDPQLAGLLGLSASSGTLSDAYLRVDTSAVPGAGIVADSIQFHGPADRYSLAGASAVATLYSNAGTSTPNPAVTLVSRGTVGGQAAAFTYDLARSVVYMRQGNPAWEGQERDGISPIRSDDLFFPDYIDLGRVAIPQADEQQRLLANLVQHMNVDRKPLPRFWYFPRNEKAVVISTGDDHAYGNLGGTAGRFDRYEANSPTGCSVADWECLRIGSYIYNRSSLTDQQAASYTSRGFEIALHVNTGCANYTPASLTSDFTTQLGAFAQKYPSVPRPTTNRTHCIVWSDWSTQAEVELSNAVRLDTTYYYYPGSWVGNRPGFFTGSGMPMRFARRDGTMLDVYQATTQMTDESGQSYPFTPNTLLDRALGAEGYYGAFTANMHTDDAFTPQDDALMASARARGVPMVTPRQMLTWLDGRNASRLGSINYSGNALTFSVTPGSGANGLTLMIPTTGPSGELNAVTRDGNGVTFATETIKGVRYAVLDAVTGNYSASYAQQLATAQVADVQALPAEDGTAAITWNSDVAADSTVRYGTSPNALTLEAVDGSPETEHEVVLDELAADTTYYYEVSSDDDSQRASFRTPPADRASPAVTDVAVQPAPDGTATATWRTDEGADAQVSFGTAPNALTEVRVGDQGQTDHSVLLTPLEPGATYHYRVSSRDEAGNESAPATGSFTTPAAGVVDTTAVELREGALQGDAYLAETDDGELTLVPAVGSEFSEPGLPTGWTATEGAASVDGGSLQVDGGSATTTDRVGSGRAATAAVTFDGNIAQAFGFEGGNRHALFTTRGGRLFASTSGASRQETPIAGDWLGAPHTYQIDRDRGAVVYSIDGAEVARHDVATSGRMGLLVRDRRDSGAAVVVDWARLTGGRSTGTYTSGILDSGAQVNWGTASWDADVPAGAAITVSVRTGSTSAPDSTWTAFRPLAESGANVGQASRYIQYRVELSSDGAAPPVLRQITVEHDGAPAPSEEEPG